MRHSKLALAAVFCAVAVAPRARAQGFSGIYVAGPGDVWLVGTGSSLIHGRAGAWVQASEANLPALHAVAGFGPNDVWIVGDEGTILHWNGAALSRPYGGTQANLVAIYGCAANDLWVLGQSEDEGQPQTVLHYNGSSWSSQHITPTFRPSGIAGRCPGDLVITGISFFDPRPDQRREVGVVARLRAGSWVASGWDGRRINDELLGGTAWTGAASGAGAVLIWGRGTALISRAGGAWTPLAGAPAAVAMTVTAEGSLVAIHAAGFSRLAGGQWHTVGQGAMETSATNALVATSRQAPAPSAAAGRDTAAVRRITARMQAISHSIPDGGMPNQAQMTEMMQLQQQLMAANGGSIMPGGMSMEQIQQMSAQAQTAQAEAQRNQGVAARNATLRFGENPAVFGGPGSGFYVAGADNVFHVSGDASKVIFTRSCLGAQTRQLPASMLADCRADGGTGSPPAALNVPPPMPQVEGPVIPAPSGKKPKVRIP